MKSEKASHAGWKAEFIAEDFRPALDVEAQQRVEAAVDQAIININRYAMPWFEKNWSSIKSIEGN